MTLPVTNNRPCGRLDSQGRLIYDSVDDTAFQGEYSTGLLVYAGFARPGSSTSDPVWKIMKLNYTTTNLTSIVWPEDTQGNASNDYLFAWTSRASYTYA